MRPARDDADLFTAVDDRVAVPRDPSIHHLEPDQSAARPLGALALQDVAAHEVALLQLHDPGEVGLDRRGGVVDVVTVECHLCFEAQRIARAKTAWLYT